MKLTDPIIKAAKPKEKPYSLADGHGLSLYVQPAGAKWWRYRYRFNGTPKMLSIGVYPDVTLKEARNQHEHLKELLSQGIAPSENRKEEKQQAAIAAANSFESVPAERMKMRSPHIVPLSQQAITILEEIRKLAADDVLLFPSERRDGKSMSNNTILYALYRLGYHSRMTGHGFRGVASTILHEQGFNHDHIELQLAHTQRDAVSAAYNHALYLEPRAHMMQAWADYLDKLKAGAEVLPFKAA